MSRPALFLDRDGVINHNRGGYTHRIEDFKFIEGIFPLGRIAVANGYQIVVVTNQAGIGRGYYTEAQFEELTAWMRTQFSRNGIEIAGVYHCPHHPTHGLGDYLQECDCRKPRPGLLLRAREQLGIDLGRSVLIGDKASDIEAARLAGVGSAVLLAHGQLPLPPDAVPAYIATDHADISRWLTRYTRASATTARTP